MEKTLIIGLMVVMMIAAFTLPMVLAEENNSSLDTSLESEAAAYDNATTSTGEIMSNRIKSWFTFNQEKKLDLEMKLADLRLIQARIAAKNNNTQAMEKALEAHERIINRIQMRMNRSETSSDFKGLNNSANIFVGLERAIQVHELKIARLNTILANSNLTDDRRAKIEAKIAKTQNVTNHLRDVQGARMEKLKTKLMAFKNMTEDEADKFVNQKRDDARERVSERLEEHSQKQQGDKDGNKSKKQ